MSLEDHYGKCIDVYEGTGSLKSTKGASFNCKFEAGQLRDGTMVLLCTSLPGEYFIFDLGDEIQLQGQTKDGKAVESQGRNTSINILADSLGRPGSRMALKPSKLVVTVSDENPAKLRFGLTNFRMSGPRASFDGRWHDYLPLRLVDHEDQSWCGVQLRPVESFRETMLRVSTLRSIEVTCTAEVDVEKFGPFETIETVMRRLCLIASVARGTKIEWVYCDQLNRNGKLIGRTHVHRVTKPYGALSVIDYRGDDKATWLFLEGAYTTFCKRCEAFELDRGTIDSYIDAKSESDFIETRGAKLAVALEGLKHTFLHRNESAFSELIIPDEKFEELKPKLIKAIDAVLRDDPEVTSEQRTTFVDKKRMRNLNRRSFRYALTKLFKEIEFKPNGREVDLFIECRNKLVHAADFYCNVATPSERAEITPLADAVEEYYFMVNFLDRVFLKLLGYSGEYLNIAKLLKGEEGSEAVDATGH
ncbi:MAG TPA: hypothetical protein PLK77_14495 [Pyrinomonadaceae bacterium]|nr:hypothetical protein [Pyrinomonadaceae bacterium]